MKKVSLTDRTFGGLFLLFTGSGTQAVLQFTVLIVMARALAPEEFGVVGAAMVVVGFSQIFSQVGVGAAIVQQDKLTDRGLRTGFTLSVVLSVFMACVVFQAAPLISSFFRMPNLVPVIQVLSLLFPISGLSLVAGAVLQREMQFRQLAAIQVGSFAIGYGLVGITLAFMGYGVWALVFAHLGQGLATTVFKVILKPHTIGFSLRVEEARHLLGFGTGVSLAKIANSFAVQADNLVVGRWLGAEALGIYGRAYQFLMFPVNLLGSVSHRVLFPALASIQNDRTRVARAYIRAVAIIAMIVMPISAILIVLATDLVLLILGPQWDGVVLPFQLLAAVMVFRTSYKISNSLASATGAVYRQAWRQAFYGGAVFLGAWIGHFWGLGGVAVGVGAAVVLNFMLMLQLCISITGASWIEFLLIHVRHLGVAILVGGIAWCVKMIGTAFGLSVVFIVAAGIASAGVATLGIVIGFRRVLGKEGEWLWDQMLRHASPLAVRLGVGKGKV